MKRKERKAFWIGLGTTLAIIFLLVGFLSLIFSGKNSPKPADQTQKEAKQETTQEEPAKSQKGEDSQQSSQPEEQPSSSEGEASDNAELTHEVESGDTLYSIGLEYDVDWQRIAEVNDLSQDATLQPGQELIIPSE